MEDYQMIAFRSVLLAGASLALFTPSLAWAQTAPAADDAVADIIVTAQKRSERLQDVPVAVSVISGDAISTGGKPSLEGATQLVPSLNFVKAGSALNQTLFLRGLGTTSLSIAFDPTVSTVLDGVVFSRSAEAFTDLVDIDRIEVLRGPQSTLFGRNASAGVINIVSRRPSDVNWRVAIISATAMNFGFAARSTCPSAMQCEAVQRHSITSMTAIFLTLRQT
jgi:iron complex outermembrane recepter protein